MKKDQASSFNANLKRLTVEHGLSELEASKVLEEQSLIKKTSLFGDILKSKTGANKVGGNSELQKQFDELQKAFDAKNGEFTDMKSRHESELNGFRVQTLQDRIDMNISKDLNSKPFADIYATEGGDLAVLKFNKQLNELGGSIIMDNGTPRLVNSKDNALPVRNKEQQEVSYQALIDNVTEPMIKKNDQPTTGKLVVQDIDPTENGSSHYAQMQAKADELFKQRQS